LVANDILPILKKYDIQWIATDEKVLVRSLPNNQPKYSRMQWSTKQRHQQM